jgi:hypothetical protein
MLRQRRAVVAYASASIPFACCFFRCQHSITGSLVELVPAIKIFCPLFFKSVIRSALPVAMLAPSQYPMAYVLARSFTPRFREGSPPPFCQSLEYNRSRNHVEPLPERATSSTRLTVSLFGVPAFRPPVLWPNVPISGLPLPMIQVPFSCREKARHCQSVSAPPLR